jgi:hypothetical protein
MTGRSLSELIVSVIRHRSYKNLGPMDADEVSEDIQRQICERVGPEFSRPEPGDGR